MGLRVYASGWGLFLCSCLVSVLIVCGGGWRGVGLCPLSGLYVAGRCDRGAAIALPYPLRGQGCGGKMYRHGGLFSSVCSLFSLILFFCFLRVAGRYDTHKGKPLWLSINNILTIVNTILTKSGDIFVFMRGYSR